MSESAERPTQTSSVNRPPASTMDSAEGPPRVGEYVVVARRYRPQTFQDLVGQGTVSQALCNAITTDRVGHAYLFTGARGVGKTSTARILAKSLNCVQGPTATPCGECDICTSIARGDDVDVLEIDGASNRGIDEIRQLRSNVGIRPSRARFKVYIIDEVHMLTEEAFNALLKTLEEPPEHVKFVFCTTEPGRIPVTVLSRCQRFDFAPVMTNEIVTRLQFIVQQEGAEAEAEALELLARRAAGSMRDSQSLLEQLLSFVGDRISVDHVHAMLGTAHDARLQAIVQALSQRDAATALAEVDQALKEGVDAGQLAEQLIGSLRDMMAAHVGCSGELLMHHRPTQLDALRQAASQWGLASLLAAVQIVDQAMARMRQSVHERTLLELALVRIAQLEDLDDLSALIQRIDVGQGGPLPNPGRTVAAAESEKKKAPGDGAHGAERQPVEAYTPPPQIDADRRESVPSGKPQQAASTPTDSSTSEAAVVATAVVAAPLQAEQIGRLWRNALEGLNDMTADYAGMADSVAISGPNRLVVRFRQVYNSSKSFCERPERRQALEQAVSQAAGRDIRLEFELVHEDQRHETPPPPIATRQTRQRSLAQHPLVERAVELFEAEVIKVDVASAETAPSERSRQ